MTDKAETNQKSPAKVKSPHGSRLGKRNRRTVALDSRLRKSFGKDFDVVMEMATICCSRITKALEM